MAPLVWMVVWVDARGRGLGMCGHRHASAGEATLCPFEPAACPMRALGWCCDPDYRAPGERRPARQLELDLGERR